MKQRRFPKLDISSHYEDYLADGGYKPAPAEVTSDDVSASDVTSTAASRNTSTTVDESTPHYDAAISEDVSEESPESKVDRVISLIGSQNSLREVLYKTLEYCREIRDFSEVEDFISQQDEYVYSHIIQSPFTMIGMLVRAGGLEQTDIDDEGAPVTEERRAGLTEDEIDDLIATTIVVATPAGAEAVELLSPQRRLMSLLAQKPHRRDTFIKLMEFCTTPRKFPEIETFFKETPGLARDVVAQHHTLSPDFYVDKLDKAGALVWQGAWIITDMGRAFLATQATA